MKENVSLIALIGIMCTVFGSVATFITLKRNYSKDTKEEAKEAATNNAKVETKLDYIAKSVDDIRIKSEARDLKISDIDIRLVRVEESTKSAHHRIDELGKGE
jgi:capsular polysaccharide biosynthesis protein